MAAMIDLSSDTATRPSAAMRASMAQAPGRRRAAAGRPDGERAAGARGRAAGQGGGALPAVGDDGERDRGEDAHEARRRGRSWSARRISRHRRRAERRSCPGRCCTGRSACAGCSRSSRSSTRFARTIRTARGRASSASNRPRILAAGRCGRSSGCGPWRRRRTGTPRDAHGRRADDERRGGLRHPRARARAGL